VSHRLERASRCSSLFMLFVIGSAAGILCGAGGLLYALMIRSLWTPH